MPLASPQLITIILTGYSGALRYLIRASRSSDIVPAANLRIEACLCLRNHGCTGADLDWSPGEDLREMVCLLSSIKAFETKLTMVPIRLNAKVKQRDVAVQDLVKDLSDGVCATPSNPALTRWSPDTI